MTCVTATNATTFPQPQVLFMFPAVQAARDYRHTNGTGGIIFTNADMTILFPPDVDPIGIFNHPVTSGKQGLLILS